MLPGTKFFDHSFQVICLPLSNWDLSLLLLDLLDLSVLSLRSLPYLIIAFFGKTNTEQTKQITISSLNISTSFSHGLPFVHCGTQVAIGKICAMEVGQLLTLNIPSS